MGEEDKELTVLLEARREMIAVERRLLVLQQTLGELTRPEALDGYNALDSVLADLRFARGQILAPLPDARAMGLSGPPVELEKQAVIDSARAVQTQRESEG